MVSRSSFVISRPSSICVVSSHSSLHISIQKQLKRIGASNYFVGIQNKYTSTLIYIHTTYKIIRSASLQLPFLRQLRQSFSHSKDLSGHGMIEGIDNIDRVGAGASIHGSTGRMSMTTVFVKNTSTARARASASASEKANHERLGTETDAEVESLKLQVTDEANGRYLLHRDGVYIYANTGTDARTDTGTDARTDTGTDMGTDAGTDTETYAGTDAGTDTETYSGTDAGLTQELTRGLTQELTQELTHAWTLRL